MPPPDLASLTTEQLQELEEASRAGVEARLRCLRNIQLLLDASVVLMQQYSAAAAAAASRYQTPKQITLVIGKSISVVLFKGNYNQRDTQLSTKALLA